MDVPDRFRNVFRWFVHELFNVPRGDGLIAVCTGLCRLTGWSVTAMALYVMWHGQLSGPLPLVIAKACLATVIAAAVGYFAKELAFYSAAAFLTARGRAFTRSGLLPGGGRFHETLHADRTWVRWEERPDGMTCEWAGANGKYHRLTAGERVW